MTDENTEIENNEGKITLTQGELQLMTQTLMGGALQIDNMEPNSQRAAVMQETWDLTQLLIKQKVRECRKAINDDLLSFLNSFPEALEAVKTGLGIQSASEDVKEEEE